MKATLLSTAVFNLILCVEAHTQTTITLQPDATGGKDSEIGYIVPNNNYATSKKLSPYAWTQTSSLNIVRPLLEFDLSGVPTGSTIVDAKLSLYFYPDHPSIFQHSGSNALWIERITSSWGESTVTWNNQPTTTTVNRVSVPPSSQPTQNYENINVTALVQDIIDNAGSSFGFMLKLQDETPYNVVMLTSSDDTASSRRPKLVVTYSPSVGVAKIVDSENEKIMVSPNPFSTEALIVTSKEVDNGQIKILDLLGREVKNIEFTGNKTTLQRGELHDGVYFIQLIAGGKVLAHRKINIE